MKIIVDTNIVFSAILNSHGKIGELLLNKPTEVQFLSPNFLLEELTFHSGKIIRLSNLNKVEYEEIKAYVIQHIEFIDIGMIGIGSWNKAAEMIGELDEKDIPFVALAIEIDAFLWTGDKKLTKELHRKKFDRVLATDMLYIKYFG
ncbi:MAG: PIN domain-containing protein [Mucilaginibacter sp.]